MSIFRIGVALLYHEARHVRRIDAKTLRDSVSWGTFRGLPNDRWEAWRQVRPLFDRSSKLRTAGEVETVFINYFAKTLKQLEELFEKASWPNRIGGENWAKSANAIRTLGDAIDSGDTSRMEKALPGVKAARHNTGTLMDKYRQLESRR